MADPIRTSKSGFRPGASPLPQTLTIERVPLDSLHLDASNARQHGEGNLAAIQASLLRFGQTEPLVVQAVTCKVIGGNGRVVAMRELGWTECDVVFVDLDDTEAIALGISLNRTAELADWDLDILARLLEEMRSDDGLEGVGFDEADLDALIEELEEEPEPKDVDDPGPSEPPAVPVSRPGDLWQLGDHRLLCGDATKVESFETLLAGQTVTLLATDPPYCIDYTGANRPVVKGKPSGKDWSALYREIDITDYGDFLRAFITAVLPHIVLAAPIYMWHAHLQQQVLVQVFEEQGILFHQVIVWVKPTAAFGHSYFQWRHEPCAFGWRKGHKPKHGVAQMTTVWEVDWEGKLRVVGNEHPTQKPLRLFEIPMELHTRPGDIVLEPFSGSGSQILAAERRGRRCYALEICAAFVDVAVRRWEKATGGQARLQSTGATFAEVAEERVDQAGAERSAS